MIALGSNVHIFARPHRREELARCFESVLGDSPVRTVEFPGIDQPMLVIGFPGGGHLSIEFTDEAPDDEHPQLGAWLELRADDPAALLQAALDAGLTQVRHPGHPYYFMVPRRPGVHHRADELNAAIEDVERLSQPGRTCHAEGEAWRAALRKIPARLRCPIWSG